MSLSSRGLTSATSSWPLLRLDLSKCGFPNQSAIELHVYLAAEVRRQLTWICIVAGGEVSSSRARRAGLASQVCSAMELFFLKEAAFEGLVGCSAGASSVVVSEQAFKRVLSVTDSLVLSPPPLLPPFSLTSISAFFSLISLIQFSPIVQTKNSETVEDKAVDIARLACICPLVTINIVAVPTTSPTRARARALQRRLNCNSPTSPCHSPQGFWSSLPRQ